IEQARSIFDTNFFGLIRMTRAVVPHMRRQGSGRIINIGSILGVVPMPYVALYAASKHAVEGLTKAAALEGAANSVRVNAVAPGPVETEMLNRFTGGGEGKENLLASVPVKRAATPQEIADTIVFLACKAPFLTGQSIVVDGGKTAA
ncbi:MAG: SDR family NAD(P)-dependent oxidoreductase, partial [Terriglobia bacterium]